MVVLVTVPDAVPCVCLLFIKKNNVGNIQTGAHSAIVSCHCLMEMTDDIALPNVGAWKDLPRI